MLVTRQVETEQNPWSISKFETIYNKPASPRMSNFDAPLSTQPEWQGQYSFPLPGEGGLFSQTAVYDHSPAGAGGTTNDGGHHDSSTVTSSRPRSTELPDLKSESASTASPLSHRRSIDPLGLRQPKQQPPSPIPEHPEHHQDQSQQQQQQQQHANSAGVQSTPGDMYAQKAAETTASGAVGQDDAGIILPSGGGGETLPGLATALSSVGVAPGDLGSVVVAATQQQQQQQQPSQGSVDDGMAVPKGEDDDDVLDDDDMDADGTDGQGGSGQPQTAAERTAQRRKMKRFRLTHQQTRFLMSEFAKQPHPDAAHRERLSREIPGLSPRQVQVWFQNRRAKIKRLTADDRDRMIKMRAVPDDFDNVGALHAPYGAVHGLGTPMASPVDFGGNPYGDPHGMMRPLMVDVRRPDDGSADHMSPTGLSPAFGSIGFNPSGGPLGGPSDMLSPLSPTSTADHRGGYGGYSSHLSTPLSAGGPQRSTSNPFGRQNSLDSTMMGGGGGAGSGPAGSQGQRQHIRPLQPLQLRDAMTRSRSDNLQSPLRSSMSWKGDSIDYNSYPGASGSPQLGGQHGSVYRTDQSSVGYDSSSYGVQSPTHMTYPSMPSSSLQQPSQNRARLRAASATLPMALDLRNQYRSMGSGSGAGSGGVSQSSTTPRGAGPSPMSPYGAPPTAASSSSIYTSSFPSAPLTAPIDFGLSRSASGGGGGASGLRTGPTVGQHSQHQHHHHHHTTDYSMPQMSAPLNPPSDFSTASQAFGGMGSSASRTPMRDSFGGAGSAGGYGQATGSDRPGDDYGTDGLGLKRKHSFTSSAPSGNGPTAYGSTA